jgi:hypothetical protein
MVRVAAFFLLFSSLTLTAQKTEIVYLSFLQQTICGPIGVQVRILDSSQDRPLPFQKVGITLKNLTSTPIVLERFTIHYGSETPTSSAPFEKETRVEVGAGREAVFVEAFSDSNPVSYVEMNSVRYADGSSWQPSDGAVCKITPEPLKN